MNENKEETKIKNALLKKALGHFANEISEEYLIDDNGNEVLSKRKKSKKYISPDMTAVKILLTEYLGKTLENFSAKTDEELKEEIQELLNMLNNN
ncbi:MAG: hypothetical protein RR247_00080 [Clostridia bacterium]